MVASLTVTGPIVGRDAWKHSSTAVLIWSVSRGAFKDIEAPKWRMMKLEQRYTEEEGGDPSIWQTEEEE